MAEQGHKVQRHASSNFFYFVAAALGISFSCVLVVLAWNNALRNETRDFNFNTIAVRNEVEANIRTADAIIANLASFIAADEREDRGRFSQYTAGSLKRYAFIDGMARIRIEADGQVRVIQQTGKAAGDAVAALLTGDPRARDTVNNVIGQDAAESRSAQNEHPRQTSTLVGTQVSHQPFGGREFLVGHGETNVSQKAGDLVISSVHERSVRPEPC